MKLPFLALFTLEILDFSGFPVVAQAARDHCQDLGIGGPRTFHGRRRQGAVSGGGLPTGAAPLVWKGRQEFAPRVSEELKIVEKTWGSSTSQFITTTINDYQ